MRCALSECLFKGNCSVLCLSFSVWKEFGTGQGAGFCFLMYGKSGCFQFLGCIQTCQATLCSEKRNQKKDSSSQK